MIELQYPEMHIPAPDELRYYVCTTHNHTGRYLAGDGNLQGLPWLFNSFDEAILASAKYYHDNGYAYPWKTEMIAAGARFMKNVKKEETETIESTVMVFEK